MVDASSFSQPYLCIQTPLQYPPKITSSTSVSFHISIPPLLVYKIILINPTNTPSTSQHFWPPYFWAQPSQQSTPKVFSLPQPFSQFRLHQAAREIGSLVRTNTVLFSPLTLKVWTVTTRLTITDSSSIFCSYLTQ